MGNALDLVISTKDSLIEQGMILIEMVLIAMHVVNALSISNSNYLFSTLWSSVVDGNRARCDKRSRKPLSLENNGAS